MRSPARPSELRAVVATLRPFFTRAGWFSLTVSLLLLMPTWYMLTVYERVVNSRSHLTLAMVTILVVGAYGLMEILEWVRADLMLECGLAFDRALSDRVFNAAFEADLRKLPLFAPMALNDLRTVRDAISSSAMLAAMEVPVSLVFLVLIFAVHPILGWTAACAGLLQVILSWWNDRTVQPHMMEASNASYGANLYAEGALRNAQAVASMGMIASIHRRWIGRQRAFLRSQAKGSLKAGRFQALSKLTQTTVSSALLGSSAWLLINNQLPGGSGLLIAAGVLGARMLTPLVQVVGSWRVIINARESWERLDALLTALPAKQETMSLPPPIGRLWAEDIVASAPRSNTPILKGVSFDLHPGEVLGVAGASAAGKSTLARLLVGVWPTISGKVRLDGVDVFSWNKVELGPHVGYLPQSIELFAGTLAENIARFGAVDMDKVQAAAMLVGIHDYVMTLPLGYRTPIGIEGATLSGGYRQRVGLARAIYGEPRFVVLDEPNSSLDEAGDAALNNLVAELKLRGTTFVLITHRSSVFSVCDKLLVLHEGRTIAYGPIGQVLASFAASGSQHPPTNGQLEALEAA